MSISNESQNLEYFTAGKGKGELRLQSAIPIIHWPAQISQWTENEGTPQTARQVGYKVGEPTDSLVSFNSRGFDCSQCQHITHCRSISHCKILKSQIQRQVDIDWRKKNFNVSIKLWSSTPSLATNTTQSISAHIIVHTYLHNTWMTKSILPM